jgi:hypothetical protein
MIKKVIVFILVLLLVPVAVVGLDINDNNLVGGLQQPAIQGAKTYTYAVPEGQICASLGWSLAVAGGGASTYKISSEGQSATAIDGAMAQITTQNIKDSTEITITCTRPQGCNTGYTINLNKDCQQQEQEQEEQDQDEGGECVDGDGDGRESNLCGGTDCNDNDAAIFPGNAEVCGDGKDNNCNTQVDENCAVVPPPTTPVDPAVTCVEAWTCGGWEKQGECVEGEQMYVRICTDQNNCGTVVTKPVDIAPVECSDGESEAPTDEVIEELEESAAMAPADNTAQDTNVATNNESEGTPKYVWAIIGGAGGLLAIFAIAGIIFFIKKQ